LCQFVPASSGEQPQCWHYGASRRIAVESVVAGIGLSVLGMVAAAFGYLTVDRRLSVTPPGACGI